MVSRESRYTHTWDLGRACLHYGFDTALHSWVSVLPGEGGSAFDGGDYRNELLATYLLLTVCCLDQSCAFQVLERRYIDSLEGVAELGSVLTAVCEFSMIPLDSIDPAVS